MNEKKEIAELTLLILAGIGGCLGACSIASHRLISGNKIRLAMFLAYAIIGLVSGLLFAAYGSITTDQNFIAILAPSIISGATVSLALGGTGAGAKLVCKKLGFEIILLTKKIDNKEGDQK